MYKYGGTCRRVAISIAPVRQNAVTLRARHSPRQQRCSSVTPAPAFVAPHHRRAPPPRSHCPTCALPSGAPRRASSSSSSSPPRPTPGNAGRSAHRLRSEFERVRRDEERRAAAAGGSTSGSRGSKSSGSPSLETLLSHAGLSLSNHDDDGNGNEPLSPSIDLATTYERPPDGNYGEDGRVYSRTHNPTRKLLEDVLGQLEVAGATTALSHDDDDFCDSPAPTFAFSSGMAAVASLLLAHSSPVLALLPADVYHGVPTQLREVMTGHGIRYEVVDMTDPEAVVGALDRIVSSSREEEDGGEGVDAFGSGGSLIVWMESPSNPLCQVTDIRAVCEAVNDLRASWKRVGRNTNITLVVDSTWAPPCLTQPLLLGADAVLHSGTKYLSGHSDVLLGTVSCSPTTPTGIHLASRLAIVQSTIGAVASPLESWLTIRGLRTLHLRVARQSRTAMRLALFLEGHEGVVRCHYPGLVSHPQHGVARRQMGIGKNDNVGVDEGERSVSTDDAASSANFGGMLSFEVESESMAMAVAGAVRIVRRATSLGGTETLIEHRYSIEPPGAKTSPPELLRLSVGLEDFDDLCNDLSVALEVAARVCSGGENNSK